MSGLNNKIIKDELKIRKYLKDKTIAEYQRHYELSFRNKPHILPDAEQKVLSTMSIIDGGFSTIFSTLNDGEIKFEDAVNHKNKKIPLRTVSDVMMNLKHQDRSLRKTTWISFNKAYHNYENTLTQLLYHNYLMLNTSSKLHKFTDYIHATAFEDEIDTKLITTLYENVALFKHSVVKYKKTVDPLLKHQLKLNKLEP
ncbi:hypothetical protein FACS1894218_3710 [Bacilli bacterium]|nr:hypothetical protein FACS1894218_3710 [Bacilli bacterium]